MADDMGYECLENYGSTEYKSPELDRMAEEGIRFIHAYSQPLCTPSRVKIMTGKYNYRNYVGFEYLDRQERTFGNIMQEAGYITCIAGKWQLNGRTNKERFPDWNDTQTPYQFGFDTYCLWQLHVRGNRYRNPKITKNGKVLDDELKGQYGPDIFRDFIFEFMSKHRKEPFFVYYPMVLPHRPFVPTPDSEEWTVESSEYKEDTSFFADMVSYTDKIVGQIIKKTKELGIAENTLIIFTCDNGTHGSIRSKMNDGTIIPGGKGKMHDYGTRVPLIAYWKNHTKGIVNDDLIDFSDFYPTLADIAGINLKEDRYCDGKSFLNILLNRNYDPKEYIFMHYPERNMGQFVRNKTYKLYRNGGFYKVKTDPEEKHSLQKSQLNKRESKIMTKFQSILKDKPSVKK
jgi:arylsulfatase A